MKNALINLLPENVLRLLKKLFLVIRGYYYYGHLYECPICNHHFRKMLPGGFDLDVIREKNIIGSGRRENDICPRCQSTDRDRLVFLFLKKEIDIFNQKVKILHVSPEPSLYNNLIKYNNILYLTGTKYSEGIYYHKHIKLIDLLDLPYNDNEFDVVICNHVLEHITDDAKAMSEIYRVTIKGGLAILQVPISNQLAVTYEDAAIKSEKQREKHFGQFDHVRIYGRDYKNRLENVGFTVQTYTPLVEKSKKTALNKFALNVNEKLYVAYKN